MKILCIILAIWTNYIDHTYKTECAVDVNAPAEVSDSILARFIKDFQSSPDALFDWAFSGVGTQEGDDNEKNAFLLEYKYTEYIPEKNYGKIVTDIVVPGITRFKDITLIANVIDERNQVRYNRGVLADNVRLKTMPRWSRHMDIRVSYSGKLIKEGYGNLFIIPVDERHSIYFMDINIRYGWFFNIFVTRKVYRNSVEWRVNRYMNNLKQVAETTYLNEK